MKKNRRAFLIFMAPSFLGVAVFVIIPFMDVFRRSFTTAVTGKFTGIANYKTIFENQAFLTAVINTFRFTLVCIPLLVLIGFLIALPLSRFKNAGLLKSIYLFPLAMPTATIVIVWKMVFYKQGFLNLLLTKAGMWTGLWGEFHTGADMQLYLEEYRLYGGLVACRNTGHTGGAFRCGEGRRSRQLQEGVVHYSPQFKGNPLYHCDFVFFKFF